MAIRLSPVRPVTDEELLALSERNPGYQFERTAKGELVVSPTGGETGRRNVKLIAQLESWNVGAAAGVVFDSSIGFNLPDGSCRSPDACWVGRERWEALSREERQGLVPLCPDVVFELRSPSDTLADLREKMRSYLANGARLAVLIDPEGQAVEVYRPGQAPYAIANAGHAPVSLDPELSGFALDIGPIVGE